MLLHSECLLNKDIIGNVHLFRSDFWLEILIEECFLLFL